MPGRKPNPPALALLHGDQPAHTNTDTPTPDDREPQPDENMPLDETRIWRELTEELRAMGVLYRADGRELHLLVAAIARVQRMGRIITQEGYMVTGEHGRRVHPLLGPYERYCRLVHTMAGSFGLHPAGRAALHLDRLGPTEAPDDLRSHFAAM